MSGRPVLHLGDGLMTSLKESRTLTDVHAAVVTIEKQSEPDVAAVPRCPACGHPADAHDVIATRFCAATTARALPRGCACRQ
jgi:hypothetical protein